MSAVSQLPSVVDLVEPPEARVENLVLALPLLRGWICGVVEQDLAAGEEEADGGVLLEHDRHALEAVVAEEVVVVEELDQLAPRQLQAAVVVRDRAGRGAVLDDT